MKPRRYAITVDGLGLAKPAKTRRAANRSRGWWARRLGSDLDVVRFKGSPA